MADLSQPQLESRIAAVVQEILPSFDGVFDERILIREDLAADSMQVIALMIAFDAEFDVEFNADEVPSSGVSMGWLRDFISSALARKDAIT